ncbi:MAG TPA: GNAT family N-acetyltransferase [Pilimelia sp.]|nr:GNAT family N-acetyltransferase [Pilimelia sp.]
MLTVEQIGAEAVDWATLDSFPDRNVCQTKGWLSFVAATQRADVVVAAVRDGPATVGYFTGLVLERYGVRVLGAPLPGWTTAYLGFNLVDGVPRREALRALLPFAFDTLRCAHVEIRDRRLSAADYEALGLPWTPSPTHLIDLGHSEDELFNRMAPACRRSIRKASNKGVIVEPASDPAFADDFYDQLRDVFAKQGLVPTYSVDRVRALIDHLGPTGNLLLLRARDPDGRCIATAICPWFNRAMLAWGTASYRRGQHLRPNEVLIWHAMRFAKQRGVTEFDLCGGGSYKSKYGTVETVVPWARRSRSALVAGLRAAVKEGFAMRQRTVARLAALRGALAQRGAES